MAIRQLVGKLSPRGWIAVGAAVLGSIAFLYILMHVVSKPSYATIEAGVDPTQTGKMTSTLATAGIPYQLQNGGTAVAVPTADTAQARVALSTAGLMGPNQPDFSLFNNEPLGASDFQQQVTYQRALEGQLAETIDEVQGVTGAEVQLVLPNAQDELYTDSNQSSSAAVLLSGGENLDSGAVRGIAQLVASSVQGLSLDKVTITDDQGQLLWPASAGGSESGMLSKESAQDTYDQQTAAQVDAMLAQAVGPGKAMVEVSADLNANQVQQDALSYTGKGVDLSKHSETESLTSTGGNGSATGSAIPSYAQTGTTGNSNYQHKITDTTYGVDKTVTTTTVAPGTVNRQTVSLLVDSTVPASELATLKSAVENAVGYQPSRGDTISVGRMAFATPATKAPAPPSGGIMSEAKYGVAGLGALLFLFFMTRALRKRERESLGQPTWLRELEQPRSLLELEAEVADGPGTPIKRLKSPVNTARRQIEDLAEREPERVAAQVRAWMAES